MRGIDQASRVMWHTINLLYGGKFKACGRLDVAQTRKTLEIEDFLWTLFFSVPPLQQMCPLLSGPFRGNTSLSICPSVGLKGSYCTPRFIQWWLNTITCEGIIDALYRGRGRDQEFGQNLALYLGKKNHHIPAFELTNARVLTFYSLKILSRLQFADLEFGHGNYEHQKEKLPLNYVYLSKI